MGIYSTFSSESGLQAENEIAPGRHLAPGLGPLRDRRCPEDAYLSCSITSLGFPDWVPFLWDPGAGFKKEIGFSQVWSTEVVLGAWERESRLEGSE